jgi:hypothetical protein
VTLSLVRSLPSILFKRAAQKKGNALTRSGVFGFRIGFIYEVLGEEGDDAEARMKGERPF